MSRPQSADPLVRIGRRGAVAGGTLGLWWTAGCSRVADTLDSDRSARSGRSADDSGAGEEGSDREVIAQATAAVVSVRALVQATARRHVGLSEPLGVLEKIHTAHLELLESSESSDSSGAAESDGTGGTGGTGGSVPADQRAALRRIRVREDACSTDLARLSGQAQSGALARALASMAAGVAVGREALPTPDGGPA